MKRVEPHRLLILAMIAMAVLPHIPRIPVWILTWCVLCWGYAALATKKKWPFPGKTFLRVMAVGGFMGGFLSYGFVFSREAGLGLFSIMLGLKPLEIRSYRDSIVTVFLSIFMVISSLFYSSSLFTAMYMFLFVLGTAWVLIQINHPGGYLIKHLKTAAAITAQALPLMLLFFFLFPRIQGSLWRVANSETARVGFSGAMSPGDISGLVRSNAVAFRVEFTGDIPPREHLYWRGLVLWHFDGRGWTRGPRIPEKIMSLPAGETVDHVITLEPHENRWLFGLDVPAFSTEMVRMRTDHTLFLRYDLKERLRYPVKSHAAAFPGPIQSWEARRSLEIPVAGNEKALALARLWAEQTGQQPEKVIKVALEYIRNNDFFYTLNPPVLGPDSVDDFLFRTRRGYCEHYASAFAFLMRAARIPSRIVIGYMGGEVNPYGDYVIVRQSNAHAWVEVWLADQGWVRIDPTGAIAPGRIELDAAAALSPEAFPQYLPWAGLAPLLGHWRNIKLRWDVVNNYWNIWVMGYSDAEQTKLLKKVGFPMGSWKNRIKTLILFFGFIGLFSALLFMPPFKKSAVRKDKTFEIYTRFCRKLGKMGLPRSPHQGPADYARTAAALRKDLAPAIHAVTALYIQLRYGAHADAALFKKFRSLVKKFQA
ncbi:MAG: DUF3488 and transglutaminase-like domain-containing protein [Desulfobacterales bacterium]|nr:DUF3488 and transglutaminase-like domain-containing protein [Desulfobacterales bacterium]